MTSQVLQKRRSSGLTVLELAVVMVIILILASLLFPIYANRMALAEETKCLANLRGLYVAASGYLQANGSWPQIPINLATDDPETFAHNWVDALAPFGAPHPIWVCPGIQRGLGQSMNVLESPDVDYRIDYMPLSFDDNPTSPHRWQKYPWFVEKSGFHSRGNLIIYADGTIVGILDVAPPPSAN